MKIVDYKEPKLYKDKDNKKWFILYSVKYDGADKWTPQKEYGKNYTLDRKSLNSIADLKKREVEFIKVIGALEHHLKAGISIKVPETVKVAVEERIKESKKKAFDENFTAYFVAKGFYKPIPKKERSSQQFKGFFQNQFRPYLKKKGFLNDLSLVTKADLNEFMNIYYQSTDPKVKWSNTTWVNKKGMLGSFFQYLVDEDILMDNPVKKVKSKKKEATAKQDLILTLTEKTTVGEPNYLLFLVNDADKSEHKIYLNDAFISTNSRYDFYSIDTTQFIDMPTGYYTYSIFQDDLGSDIIEIGKLLIQREAAAVQIITPIRTEEYLMYK